MIGIYKITNKINNKCYIGQSVDIKIRWLQHIYEGKKNNPQGKLYRAIFNEGIDNFSFEVLEECPLNEKILNEKEKYWIKYYNSFEEGYNSTKGGQGEDSWIYDPTLIRTLWDEGYTTGEIKKIIGCSSTTINNRLKGYKNFNAFTSHQRSCGRDAPYRQFLVMSDEQLKYFNKTIEVHQYSLSGEYIASFSTLEDAAKAVNGKHPDNIGRLLKKTTNQKTAYGYQWSKEKVDKLPPVPIHLGKLVRCIETGQIFPSIRAAADWCNLKSHSSIQDYLTGKGHKSAGKHPITNKPLHWEYVK